MTPAEDRSRAVLFGVHDFRRLTPLSGVRFNVPALRALLTSEDVGGLAEEDCVVVPPDGTRQEMLDALHDAAEEATDLLLVYYAGHGHFDGGRRSFLLATRDSDPRRPYHSVKYDEIRELVRGSAARRKVVIVDCCYSGLALAMSDDQPPTPQDVEIIGACVLTSAAEDERSLCLPDGSVFTLELARLMAEGLSGDLPGGRRAELLPGLSMAEVFGALHSRLQGREIDGYRVPQPRMSTRDLGHQIVLCANRAYTGVANGPAGHGLLSPVEDHEWVTAVRDHPLWSHVSDERGLALLRETATALVARAAGETVLDGVTLPGDPWRSAAFTDRLAEWTDSLVLDSSLRPEELELSAAEVFLLVTHPYLQAVFWRHSAGPYSTIGPTVLADTQSTSRGRQSYEGFLAGLPRLVRRALRAGDTDASEAIGWWLFHRWLIRQSRIYEADAVEVLLDRLAVPLGDRTSRERRLVEEVLDPRLIAQLLRAPHFPSRQEAGATRPRTVGAAETAQRVRVHQLAELLRIAHLFAIDPIALPDVVVDHIGIGYAVDLAELHGTLAGLRWEPNGRTRVLSATCGHLAVDLALRQHAAALDTLLARIDIEGGEAGRPALLRHLPLHVTADQVTPGVDADGRGAYESTELRFRLADDHIQELLMGEALYGDPALAIRELYQNALDACRYRAARTSYLRATGSEPRPYRGTITFTQGADERGPYLECRDNGIGMGRPELRDVFSHAGMRFSDLPEYFEERARWQEHGIEMHPNSQFGVGVLSYFMLADDITVTTCRLTRAGLPGEHLRVEIAGPGALFRIQRLEPCQDAYTSVRLRLRSADTASCVDVLRRILWLSEYEVRASDESTGQSQAWRPDILGDRAPLGTEDPYLPGNERTGRTVVVAGGDPSVWWCSTNGALLADGLWAGTHRFGAVVNLTGRHRPRLTVDRRRMIDADIGEAERLLRQAIPALLATGDAVLTSGWLGTLLHESPAIADAIFLEAVRAGFGPWRIGHRTVDITKSGYFARDTALLHDVEEQRALPHYPPSVDAFRQQHLAAAGFYPGLTSAAPLPPAPLPSDTHLLLPGAAGKHMDWSVSALAHGRRVAIGVISEAARHTGRPTEEIADRLRRLGFSVTSVPPSPLGEEDRLIVSGGHTVEGPWLDPGAPVHPAQVISAARATGRTVEHVVRRLTALGYRIAYEPLPLHEADDLTLLSRDLDARVPWLALDTPVNQPWLERAARTTARSVEEVSDRLRRFGVPVSATPMPSLDSGDLALLRRYTSMPDPWLDPDEPVHPGHIVNASVRTGRTVQSVTRRLVELGYRPRFDSTPSYEDGDSNLLSRKLNGGPPWLDPEEVVAPALILRAAAISRMTTARVVARLEHYGLTTAGGALRDAAPADRMLMSRDLDSSGPWLDLATPLRAAHVLRGAALLGVSVRAVVVRLEELGYRLPDSLTLSAAADEVPPPLRWDGQDDEDE
ncbi:caspase family protein [Streptomyces sp. NPDC046887]|uniref:caspase, EACC1-associated type n=1 Tax=Streptomyces sp. NPDC046887 TaxID=3155472 RepID=UPI0033FD3144